MSKNLVIVESPAKAKTIEGYLGKDFTVRSSFGHVRDLASNNLSIDVEKDFAPAYVISPDKKKVIDELKKLAKTAETIWLATDEDREGEAISWHLQEVLGLKPGVAKRIVFSEITKTAILKAIDKPRVVNVNLVNAQQARRVLDRLVGFELSPVLWKKVRANLSAGRVQSVAVRIIVERERAIEAFKSEAAFRIVANLEAGKSALAAEYAKKPKGIEDARSVLENSAGKSFVVDAVETKPAKRTPSAPFTTSTLQQEAGRKLGFSVSRTMLVAQKLYEAGQITYMRTDSVNLSASAVESAVAKVKSRFGDKYAKARSYANKSKGAQEAHEAIRPTDFNAESIDADRDEAKLYELIWKRTLASQMADAELEKTTIELTPEETSLKFAARGEVIVFDGFLKVYLESTDDESAEDHDSGLLPPVSVGQRLSLLTMHATERFSQAPARFSEPSLVKEMEELGIGRPSTYAPTISTIQKREYVVKESKEGVKRKFRLLTLKSGTIKEEEKFENFGSEKNKLFPTDIGTVVNDFLVENFGQILDYHFTANVEKDFDEIASGSKDWVKMIRAFYSPFHSTVEQTIQSSPRVSGERSIGIDPVSGKPVSARIGRFGPMIQIGAAEDDQKKYQRLKADQSISTITLDEALELFKLPRSLGNFEEKDMSAGTGRFGPYIKHGSTFVSITKASGLDPLTVTEEEAIALVLAKRDAAAKATIKQFSENAELFVLEGRFGPYIKMGKDNFKIPKGRTPSELTYEEVMELVLVPQAVPKKKKR